MADDRKAKLDAVIKRRDSLKEVVQRAKGRRDAAVKELEAVEADCRTRGVAPDQLDSVIIKLTERYDKEVSTFTEGVLKAEEAIKPFLEG